LSQLRKRSQFSQGQGMGVSLENQHTLMRCEQTEL
jgi:hypothetical protein